MRWSNAFIPTLREDPKDAEAISHKLMMRAGLIRRLGSGAYSYLPLGVRVLHKVVAIIREEMNGVGAQECLLPAMHPLELWKKTGRDALMGEVLIRFKDRTGKEMALGPTHEEVITDLMTEVKSHRQLPVTLYQIQTKFRDEPRPRSGVIRSKEFLMKDAYSFHGDRVSLDQTYQRMVEAYRRIFQRCGVSVILCEADSGVMGGEGSSEFMAPADSGEDLIVRCAACGYAANRDAAVCQTPDIRHQTSVKEKEAKLYQEVETPGQHTVEQVSTFLKVAPADLIKTLVYETEQDPVAVLIRGDHEVNDAKLARVAGMLKLKLASPATIERVSGAPVGFTGPINLRGVRLIADRAVMAMAQAVTGANKAQAHLIDVKPGRDFTPQLVADVRLVTPVDRCAHCGGSLEFVRTIEAGHVFKLGTKYSQALGAVIQAASGDQVPMIMGCYGIGVNRIVAIAVEQHHDANGIVWPPQIAPFDVVITVMEAGHPDMRRVGEELMASLVGAGLEVLFDDRDQSPGSKLKDADLIGVPVQVVVGKVWTAERKVEVVPRATKTAQRIEPARLVEVVQSLLDK